MKMKLKRMLTLQQQLNDETNGKEWERGLTKQGKIIDWKRAIYLELAELIDSYPWKHWKSIDAKVDYENIKVELVDIWHFVMSEILRQNYLDKKLSFDELASLIEKDIKDIRAVKKENFYQEIEEFEKLLSLLFCNFDIWEFTKEFFKASYMVGLDFNSLYQLYIGKNILNKFRQDNGYKEGTYNKYWGDKEDNEVLQEILEKNDNLSPLELYKELEREYRIERL